MYVKFIIFATLSLSLVTVVYGSSISEVSAADRCIRHENTGDLTCVSDDHKKVTYCWIDDKTGKELGCVTITAKTDLLVEALDGATIQNKPDEIFKDALNRAIQESESTTKGLNELTPGSAPLPPLTSDDTEVPSKQLGNPKFGDITDLNNDTKPSVAQKDLDDNDRLDNFEIQDLIGDNKSKD